MKFYVWALLVAGSASGAETLDMQSPPAQPAGSQYSINEYFEDGFHLRPLGPIATVPPYHLTRNGGGIAFYPENGGAYLQLLSGDSLVVSQVDGTRFNVLSIDLAEYSTAFPVPKTITWRGYYADGSYVDAGFTTDGIIDGSESAPDFQTFQFPSTFRNLVRLEATTTLFSLDNIVVERVATEVLTPVLEINRAVQLRWQSQAGVNYQIQRSSDMVAWTNYGPVVAGNGAVLEAFDAVATEGGLFWRVTATAP